MSAKIEPVEGIDPSGTLPVLYINTENSVPIDQKETYIDAEYWLDCTGFDQYESVGSIDKPEKLGIKGRGNTSWLHDGQKPYKMKLNKKTELLGMGKNKHWALLARLTNYHLFNEVLGFELGRKLEMPFVPEVRPVEVVLNGTYIGLYFLTETIRIDDNRLEIAEQPDENEDLETIGDGWLVEMDNNQDPAQIAVPQPQGYNLLITHHTPEVISDIQKEWLTYQFEQITTSINSVNKQENHWESLVDLVALAKHQIVQECLQNFDGYLGSCYIHKDTGGKWCFGPLWDLSASWVYKQEMLAERENQHLIGEFFKFPAYRKVLREVWNDYMENVGTDWVVPFLQNFYDQIREAVEQSEKVWPDTPLDPKNGFDHMRGAFLANSRFINSYVNEKCITYDINFNFVNLLENGEKIDPEVINNLFEITVNDIKRMDIVVSEGDEIIVRISPKAEFNGYYYVLINNQKFLTDEFGKAEITLTDIKQDINITIVCSPLPIEDYMMAIVGTVKDSRGNPIKNATLETSYQSLNFSTQTEDDGTWELWVCNPDATNRFILNVSAEGFLDSSVEASFTDPNDIVLKSIIPLDYYLNLEINAEYEGYDLNDVDINLFSNSSSRLVETFKPEKDNITVVKNLPEGLYILNIDGRIAGLENYYEIIEVIPEVDNNLFIELKEAPVAPTDVLISLNINETNSYNLKVELPTICSTLPYLYIAELNGEEKELKDFSVEFNNLTAAKLQLLIYGVTPSSVRTPVKEFEIILHDISLKVPIFEIIDKTNYEYYDLNGFQVDFEKSNSGVYIRSDGKKFIKRGQNFKSN